MSEPSTSPHSDLIWLPTEFDGELPIVAKRGTDADYQVKRSFTNSITGAGGRSDLVQNTQLKAASELSRELLETLYIESWAAAKVIDLIVDDVFAPGIIWKEDGENRDDMIEHLDEIGFWENLANAVRAARLFGTAMLIACPSRSLDFERPMILEDIKAGDIANLVVVDRHSLTVKEFYDDPSEPNFGKPYSFTWNHKYGYSGHGGIHQIRANQAYSKVVHESRCFRFDGIKPLTREGWTGQRYERWWGFSILQRVLEELIQDMVMSAAGADVVQRTGMPVVMVNKFREALSRGVSGPGTNPQQYADNVASNISRQRVMFLDGQDKISQLQINSSGVRDLLDSQINRLAMIAGVPVMRFTGESASGLNATGNGDAREWRTTVEAYRNKHIEPHMKRLMLTMAKNAGLSSTPEWEWGRLGELTIQEQVDGLKTGAEGVKAMVEAGLIDVFEGRKILGEILPNVNLDNDDFEPLPPDMGESLDKESEMSYNGTGNEKK